MYTEGKEDEHTQEKQTYTHTQTDGKTHRQADGPRENATSREEIAPVVEFHGKIAKYEMKGKTRGKEGEGRGK